MVIFPPQHALAILDQPVIIARAAVVADVQSGCGSRCNQIGRGFADLT